MPGNVYAGKAEEIHFLKTFNKFCLRNLDNLDKLKKIAKDAKLPNFVRNDKNASNDKYLKNATRWPFPIEGKIYELGVNVLANPSNKYGKINMCLLMASGVRFDRLRDMLRRSFNGNIRETSAEPDKDGVFTVTFYVSTSRSVNDFGIFLRKNLQGGLSLVGVKVYN